MSATVSSNQRFTRSKRCPICDGCDQDARGEGKRCTGYMGHDGKYAHCSREEHARSLEQESGGTYAHRLEGPCKCGTTHGEGSGGSVGRGAEATYVYRNAEGSAVFRVVRAGVDERTGKKRFYQQHPDPAAPDGWAKGRNGAARTLYKLPELLADDGDRPVYIVEGEKDVDTMWRNGHVATCNPEGAGKWHHVADVAKTVLRGRDVIIIADDDPPDPKNGGRRKGHDHARDVHRSLVGAARSLRLVRCTKGKDITDHFAAGGTLEELVALDETKPETSDAFRLWTPEQIWAPLEQPDYLFDGLMVRGCLALIVAYGSSFKTWLLADAAMCSASGDSWLGRFATQKPGRGILVDFESGAYEMRRRAHRIAAGRGLEIPVHGFTFVTMPEWNLSSDTFYAALEQVARDYQFIGIDSLAAGNGDVDENDARFARALNRLKAIAEKHRCVIVVLHHTRKGNADGDPREMVRGTGAIFNAADIVLQMTRAKLGFLVRQTKARHGAAVAPFLVRLEDVGPGATVVRGIDADSDAEGDDAEGIDRAKAKIVRLLGTAKDLQSGNEIHRRLKGTKKTNLDALRELEERGTVRKVEGVYRLSSEVDK